MCSAQIWSSKWTALLAAVFIIIVQLAPKPDRPIYADELEYLAVSYNLAKHGVFSGQMPSENQRSPSAFFSPAAPFLYGLLLKADPSLMESISCQLLHPANPEGNCSINYGWRLRLIMGAFASLGLWGGWILARCLGFGPVAAWMTLAVVAASGSHAYFARHFLTEILLLSVYPFFLALLALATDKGRRHGTLLLLGVSMGVLALIRPSYAYQAFAVFALLPLLRYFRGAEPIGRGGGGATALAIIGYAITVLPWMLRNQLVLGQFALTVGYDHNILAQRMVYNLMSWSEWAMAWIYWLPDFGDSLATKLFGLDAVRKLSLVEPSGYHGSTLSQTPHLLAQPDGSSVTTGYLLRIIGNNLPQHLAVTLVMAWQGLWAGKYITFVAMLLAPAALPLMSQTGRLRGYLVVATPVLFMVGFNAFVSVSIPRYNLPMLWLSALIAATLVEFAFARLAQTGKKTGSLVP